MRGGGLGQARVWVRQVEPARAGLGWAGLGWAGLGWAGLGWAGLGWAGLGWAGLGWAGLGRGGVGWGGGGGAGLPNPHKPAHSNCHLLGTCPSSFAGAHPVGVGGGCI